MANEYCPNCNGANGTHWGDCHMKEHDSKYPVRPSSPADELTDFEKRYGKSPPKSSLLVAAEKVVAHYEDYRNSMSDGTFTKLILDLKRATKECD